MEEPPEEDPLEPPVEPEPVEPPVEPEPPEPPLLDEPPLLEEPPVGVDDAVLCRQNQTYIQESIVDCDRERSR